MATIPPCAPVLGAAEGALAGPFAAGAQISTFMEYYTAASQDECNLQYTTLVMGVFTSVPGGPSPQQISELVVNRLSVLQL
jgi:hypothetical protein